MFTVKVAFDEIVKIGLLFMRKLNDDCIYVVVSRYN